MSSILDDYSYIKKKMEEIKAEESAVNAKQANPAGNDPQANPPAQTQPGVWSTGMKGSGIGSQTPTDQPYQADHYDPYGNPLYYLWPEDVVFAPSRTHEQDEAGVICGHDRVEVPLNMKHWDVQITPLPHTDTMQNYRELIERCTAEILKATTYDWAYLLNRAEKRIYEEVQAQNNQAQYNQGATPSYSKPSQGQGVLGSDTGVRGIGSKT